MLQHPTVGAACASEMLAICGGTAHLLTHSLTHLLTHSLTYSLTHSLTFQAVSRTFSGAPKKMLGYFYESLLLERERNTRELLIHMCSFGSSQSPFASAECLKSMVNTQFQVEDAVCQLTHSLTYSLTHSLIGACLHKYFNINRGFTYFVVC